MRRLVALILVLFVVSTACGSYGDSAENADRSTSTASNAGQSTASTTGNVNASPTRASDDGSRSEPGDADRVLNVGFYADITSIDPASACSTEDAKLTRQLYDGLVTNGTRTLDDGTVAVDEQKIVPALAETWDVSSDGTTYTFHLTPGVTFPSGAPVDADAVVYSFNRVLTMNQCGVYGFTAGLTDNIVSVEALDAVTVRVQLKEADASFLNAMSKNSNAAIVDKTIVDMHGGVVKDSRNEWMDTHAAGSGPYLLEELAPGERIVLRENKNYRGEPPYYQKIVYHIIPDPVNRTLLTERGNLQFSYNIPFKEQLRLAGDKNLAIVREPGLKVTFVGLNNATEPFNNKQVREALAYAVPYDAIIKNVTHGLATPMRSLVPPLMANYAPEFFDKTTDLDKARDLLAGAGYADGFQFTLDIQAGSQEFDDIAVILQQQFKQIGVDMAIRKSDLAKYYEFVRGGNTEAYLIARTTGINDPGYFLGYMLPCGSPFQYSHYCNEEVDDLLQQARRESKPERRNELYSEIQRLNAADTPDLWLYVNPDAFVMSASIQGFVYDPTLQERLANLREGD